MDKSNNLGKEKQGENLNTEFTVKEVANVIGVTPNVVRNWMKEFRDYIPLKKISPVTTYSIKKQLNE